MTIVRESVTTARRSRSDQRCFTLPCQRPGMSETSPRSWAAARGATAHVCLLDASSNVPSSIAGRRRRRASPGSRESRLSTLDTVLTRPDGSSNNFVGISDRRQWAVVTYAASEKNGQRTPQRGKHVCGGVTPASGKLQRSIDGQQVVSDPRSQSRQRCCGRSRPRPAD